MATFPKLKTAAVAQYPAQKTVRFRTQICTFVDGTEQRYRDWATPLLRWQIQFDALEATETAALDQFFLENRGAFGTFAFTDPWTGQEYPKCSFEDEEFAMSVVSEWRGRSSVTIRQNRS